MGVEKHKLPEPGDLLDKLQAIKKNKDGEIVAGPLIRFAGDKVFVTETALKDIPNSAPQNPRPRDVYITKADAEVKIGTGETIKNRFYGKDVLVKYFARSTGAPLHAIRDENKETVAVERRKEFEVFPQQYEVVLVNGDRA